MSGSVEKSRRQIALKLLRVEVRVRVMLRKPALLFALAAMATACSVTSKSPQTPTPPRTLSDLQKSGAKFKNVLRLPEFETTPEAVKVTADQTMFIANAALGDSRVGSLEYDTLYAVGLLLFAITLVVNAISIRLVQRFRQAY